jgi:hypothetical protein
MCEVFGFVIYVPPCAVVAACEQRLGAMLGCNLIVTIALAASGLNARHNREKRDLKASHCDFYVMILGSFRTKKPQLGPNLPLGCGRAAAGRRAHIDCNCPAMALRRRRASLSRILWTWFFTVAGPMASFWAISLLDRPSATSRAT